MKTISLTIPMNHNALTRAGEMLHGLASDLAPAPVGAHVATTGAEVFGGPKQQAAETVTPEAATSAAETATPALVATAPAGVEVDSDGLPWDHRIHALGAGGVHNKLKKTQRWKPKRGVDAALVTEVEAELRAAMAAEPANPVVATTEEHPVEGGHTIEQPTIASTVSPAPAPAPAPSLFDDDGTTTFPALMAAITTNGIDQATVTAAVNAQGLTSLPLLAARPDLVPAVAAALGV